MTTAASIFARHIDQADGIRHRCVLLDERHLRCLDCDHTLVIPSGVTTTSTSQRELPNIDDPTSCPRHPGNWAPTCGPCRSERIAVPDGQTKTRPRPAATDPGPEWEQAKAALASRHHQLRDHQPDQGPPTPGTHQPTTPPEHHDQAQGTST